MIDKLSKEAIICFQIFVKDAIKRNSKIALTLQCTLFFTCEIHWNN
jgi:hypothetical protein